MILRRFGQEILFRSLALAALGSGCTSVIHSSSEVICKDVMIVAEGSMMQEKGKSGQERKLSNLEDIAIWRSRTDEGRRLLAQGRLREAEVCLANALQAAIRGFGLDAPHVGMSANNIAEVYRVSGKLEQARELYFQAMECFLSHYGEEDPRSALAIHNYAIALSMIGDHKEANEMAERAYKAMKGTFGSERTETLQSQYLLAKTQWNLKLKRKANKTANDCQSILINRDSKSVENGQLACDLLCLFLEMNDRHCMMSLWEFIVGVIHEAKEEELRSIQQICEKLIDTFTQKELYDRALDVVQELEAFLRKELPRENLALAICLRKHASLLSKSPKGSMEKACQLSGEAFEMVWRLFVRKYKSRHPDIGERVLQLWHRITLVDNPDTVMEDMHLFNCIYEMAHIAQHLSDCLTKERKKEERPEIENHLRRFVSIFQMKGIPELLSSFQNSSQFGQKTNEIINSQNIVLECF